MFLLNIMRAEVKYVPEYGFRVNQPKFQFRLIKENVNLNEIKSCLKLLNGVLPPYINLSHRGKYIFKLTLKITVWTFNYKSLPVSKKKTIIFTAMFSGLVFYD